MTLKQKVDLLKNNNQHDYVIQPVADEYEIISFEKKFDLVLPKSYKDFVLNCTSAITPKDPSFGFSILEQQDYVALNTDIDDTFCNPSVEFPVVVKTEMDEDKGVDFFDITNGRVELKGTGCGNVIILIVKGKAYGQVWYDEVASNNYVEPYYKNPNDNDFQKWINEQLDSVIAKVKIE